MPALAHAPFFCVGDFIIDDDGQGYQDLGEDDYWNEREGAEDADEGGEDEKGVKRGDNKGGKGEHVAHGTDPS
jgi:hypothetical protein